MAASGDRSSAHTVRAVGGPQHRRPPHDRTVAEAFVDRAFVWFAAGTGELHLIPEPPPAGDHGSDRHACLSLDRLDETLERLEAAGYPIDRYDLLPDRRQAFVHDPFGNLVELTN